MYIHTSSTTRVPSSHPRLSNAASVIEWHSSRAPTAGTRKPQAAAIHYPGTQWLKGVSMWGKRPSNPGKMPETKKGFHPQHTQTYTNTHEYMYTYADESLQLVRADNGRSASISTLWDHTPWRSQFSERVMESSIIPSAKGNSCCSRTL